ncbi:MAG: Heparinase II/III-like protein [Paenibacillus sp.]|nr:Heparinase II/III-like protein [Paenibacillus sp.]
MRFKRKEVQVLLIILLLCSSIVPVQQGIVAAEAAGSVAMATYEDKWTVAHQTYAAPVIDGSLAEGMWNDGESIDHFQTVFHNEPVLDSPVYKVAYDASNLYIGGRLYSDSATSDSLYHVDVVIRSPSGDTYYVAGIKIAESDRPMSLNWNQGNVMSTAGVKTEAVTGFPYAVTADGPTLVLEAAIPWSSFGVPQVEAGEEWQMNIIHTYRIGTSPLISWVPIRTSIYTDARDYVVLAANVVNEGRLGSVFIQKPPGLQRWTNGDFRLDYTAFREKEVSFVTPAASGELRLHWRTLGEEWQELDDFNVVAAGTRTKVSFQHPELQRNGLYQLQIRTTGSGGTDGKLAILTFDREDVIEAGIAASSFTPPAVAQTPVIANPASSEVQTLLNLIPDRVGFRYTGLPEMPELSPDGTALYTLSSDGQSLIATKTGTSYPNPLYPENQAITVQNAKGEDVTYPYYEDTNGNRFFLSGHLWYLQRSKVIAETRRLADTDPLGAARLLYRFAQVYEGMVPVTDYIWHNYPMNDGAGPPYSYYGGMWARWAPGELSGVTGLFNALAKVKQTEAFEVLSLELGTDVEKEITEKMVIPSIDYAWSFPIALFNNDYTAWLGLIAAGKAIGQPDYIHRAVEWLNAYVESQFLSDGFYREVTLGYHSQTLAGIQSAIDALEGYSDPPGYVSPRTGRRFDNLSLQEEYPIVNRMETIKSIMSYPNGKWLSVGDSWANQGLPLAPGTSSFLLPDAGIARLALGEGTSQSQVNMTFTPKYGHHHWDPLNLTLFAEGQELLPDLGYTYTLHNYFTKSTIGHNTVVVNGRNMDSNSESRLGGSIELFASGGTLFQAMRANEESAYAETEAYSREPWFVPFAGGDGSDGYVLDIFRVSGGERHEYTLQGDANRDAYWETNVSLSTYGPYLLPEGTVVQEATSYQESGSAGGHYPGYIYVKDVQRAELTGGRYKATLHTMTDGQERAKLDVYGLLEPGSNELFIGRAPSIRSSRLSGTNKDTNDEALKYENMPKLVLRREGTNLTSQFITVMEPYKVTSPLIETVDRLPLAQSEPDAAAVQVVYGGTVDILLSNPYDSGVPLIAGDITMVGELGMIRLEDGVVTAMELFGGTLLKKGDREVAGAGKWTGEITGTLREANGDPYNAFVTEQSVPDAAAGLYATIKNPQGNTLGYLIEDIVDDAEETALVLAEYDPAFTIDEDGRTKMIYYPGRQWNGVNTFTINSRSSQTFTGSPGASTTGTVTGTVSGDDGLPLAGAAVNVTGYAGISTITDHNGTYSLPVVPVGLQRITASKLGYAKTVSAYAAVHAGATTAIVVILTDERPPQLTNTTANAALLGSQVQATSSRSGFLYVVPEGTVPTPAAIEAAVMTVSQTVYGAKVPIFSGISAQVDTSGFAAGRYVLFAIDERQKVSAASASFVLLPEGITLMDNSSPWIKYGGTWSTGSHESYIGGTSVTGTSTGAYVEIPFVGSAAKVYGVRANNQGKAAVYVDGSYVMTIDNYSSTWKAQQEIFNTGLLSYGAHVIRIERLGEKNAASTGVNINFDALQVQDVSQIPPQLTHVTTGLLAAGTPVQGMSSKDGKLHLVPAGTVETKSSIEAASLSAGTSVTVTAGVYGVLDTSLLATAFYKLVAIDTSGLVSGSSGTITIVSPSDTTIDSANPVVKYGGTWSSGSHASYIGGTSMTATANGSYVDIPFVGSSAKVYGVRSNNQGKAAVYVDGQYKTTVDNYRSSWQSMQVIVDTGSLSEGLHVIRLERIGEKNSASSGYSINFDGLLVTPAL